MVHLRAGSTDLTGRPVPARQSSSPVRTSAFCAGGDLDMKCESGAMAIHGCRTRPTPPTPWRWIRRPVLRRRPQPIASTTRSPSPPSPGAAAGVGPRVSPPWLRVIILLRRCAVLCPAFGRAPPRTRAEVGTSCCLTRPPGLPLGPWPLYKRVGTSTPLRPRGSASFPDGPSSPPRAPAPAQRWLRADQRLFPPARSRDDQAPACAPPPTPWEQSLSS